MPRYSKYYKILDFDGSATHIKATAYYDKGGYNVFTYENTSRGYYLSFTPVTREEHEYDGKTYTSESFVAFTGKGTLVSEVGRASNKKYAEAKAYLDDYAELFIRHWFPQYEFEYEFTRED